MLGLQSVKGTRDTNSQTLNFHSYSSTITACNNCSDLLQPKANAIGKTLFAYNNGRRRGVHIFHPTTQASLWIIVYYVINIPGMRCFCTQRPLQCKCNKESSHVTKTFSCLLWHFRLMVFILSLQIYIEFSGNILFNIQTVWKV